MRKVDQNRNWLIAAMVMIAAIVLFLRLSAIWTLPMVADEPDDYNIPIRDIPGVMNFFCSQGLWL